MILAQKSYVDFLIMVSQAYTSLLWAGTFGISDFPNIRNTWLKRLKTEFTHLTNNEIPIYINCLEYDINMAERSFLLPSRIEIANDILSQVNFQHHD